MPCTAPDWVTLGRMFSCTRVQMCESTRRAMVQYRANAPSWYSTSPSTPQVSANCGPLTRVCRNIECTGSMPFSVTCSQLHGKEQV